MRIRVKTTELTKAVMNVGKVISGKSIDLILENVLLKINNKISFTTTNLEQAMEYFIEGEILDNTGITETVLPYDLLRDITPKFKSDEVEMDISSKKVIIKDDDGEFTLHTLNPEAFAVIPEVTSNIMFSLPLSTFRSLIDNTIFAASKKEESRKEFKGVFFDIKDGFVNLVATDSTSLALNKFTFNLESPTNFIVPFKALDVLSHISLDEGNVDVVVSDSSIKFSLPNLSLISLLINGTFPQYESVIPEGSEFYATIAKKPLMDALDIIEVFARRGTGRIIFTFSDGNVTVESSSSSVGGGKKTIPCETNANVSLQFLGEKIIEGIEHVQDDRVSLQIQGPLHPVLVKGESSDNYIYVIMPQRPVE